jgi:hypothetical protein
MPVRRPHDPDRVSWADVATGEHDPHDTRPGDDRTGLVSADDLLEQSPLCVAVDPLSRQQPNVLRFSLLNV